MCVYPGLFGTAVCKQPNYANELFTTVEFRVMFTNTYVNRINRCIHNIHPSLKCCLQQRQRKMKTVIDLQSTDKCNAKATKPSGQIYLRLCPTLPGKKVHIKEEQKETQECLRYFFLFPFFLFFKGLTVAYGSSRGMD